MLFTSSSLLDASPERLPHVRFNILIVAVCNILKVLDYILDKLWEHTLSKSTFLSSSYHYSNGVPVRFLLPFTYFWTPSAKGRN